MVGEGELVLRSERLLGISLQALYPHVLSATEVLWGT